MDKVTLIVPTLNELKGMKEVMPLIKPEWYNQLIVLDGQSKDGTIEWAKSQGYSIFIQQGKGMWNAYKELFESGLVEGDIVITFSPDWNSLPEAIPELVKKVREGNDMVIASRYRDSIRSYDDTKLTRLGNIWLTGLVNLFCWCHYTDTLNMYRAYRKDIIQKLSLLEPIPWVYRFLLKVSTLTSWESVMAIRAIKRGLRVAEIGYDELLSISDYQGKRRRQNAFQHGFAILAQIVYEGLFRK